MSRSPLGWAGGGERCRPGRGLKFPMQKPFVSLEGDGWDRVDEEGEDEIFWPDERNRSLPRVRGDLSHSRETGAPQHISLLSRKTSSEKIAMCGDQSPRNQRGIAVCISTLEKE